MPALPENPQLMMPPTPISSAVVQSNWPEVEIERDVFAEAVRAAQESQSLEENPEEPGWEDENLDAEMNGGGGERKDGNELDLGSGDEMYGGWGGDGSDDDLGLDDDDDDLLNSSEDEDGQKSSNTSGMLG